MRVALVIALCAMGCFSDRGVAIEVDVGKTGATSVELFIGKDACDSEANMAGIECGAITPPDSAVQLHGAIYFRDDLLRYTAQVKGHTATFQLKSDTADPLPVVIAVGSAPDDQGMHPVGTATLRKLAIPVNSARIVTTTLVGASAVAQVPPSRDQPEDRVQVWPKLTPPSSCVVVEHWQDGAAKRDFVVPAGDPDCDDVAFPECNPTAYLGTSEAGDSSVPPNCFADSTATEPCVLGSFGCSDNVPTQSTTCVAQQAQVCVPKALCSICPSTIDSCIPTKIDDSLGVIPHIDCTVPLVSDTGGCTTEADINLGSHYQPGNCGDKPLLASLALTNFATIHNFGGVEMELSGASAPCDFKVIWKGGIRTEISSIDRGVIKLNTSNGAVLLPIVLHFTASACATTPFRCTIADNTTDPMWSCVH